MTLAPIALFAYKRPLHTRKVLEALEKNDLAKDSILYIFCDGPRANESQQNIDKITQTRSVVRERKWCGTVNIIEHDTNFGLARSVIDGVTKIVEEFGAIIVLEDDIRPTPFFLKYMNDGLNLYQSNDKVLSIGACNFFAHGDDVPETFFIKIPDCWGWATWKDRWRMFEEDGAALYKELKEKNLLDDFNLSGSFDFEHMLSLQVEGKNNSWAIRWQAVAYLKGMLSLYPQLAVTENIGFDDDATHGGPAGVYADVKLADRPVDVRRINVSTNKMVEKKMNETYRKLTNPTSAHTRSLKNFIRSLVRPVKRIIKK